MINWESKGQTHKHWDSAEVRKLILDVCQWTCVEEVDLCSLNYCHCSIQKQPASIRLKRRSSSCQLYLVSD